MLAFHFLLGVELLLTGIVYLLGSPCATDNFVISLCFALNCRALVQQHTGFQVCRTLDGLQILAIAVDFPGLQFLL